MPELAGELPTWAVALLLIVSGVVTRILYQAFLKRIEKIESTLTQLSHKQTKMVEEQQHEQDIRDIRDKMHADFQRLQAQIAESNRAVHGRLDDLHNVLLQLFNNRTDVIQSPKIGN